KDDLVVMASEVGVMDLEPERILSKGRLEPGRMFLVSLEQGRIIDDAELKNGLAEAAPYQDWIDSHLVPLDKVEQAEEPDSLNAEDLLRLQMAFGYTIEDQKYIVGP